MPNSLVLRRRWAYMPGGVGRALARALEANQARTSPAEHVPGRVRDGHDRIVERGLDVGMPHRDVLPFALLGASRALPLSHGSPVCSDLSGRTDVGRLRGLDLLLATDAHGAARSATLSGVRLGALSADREIAPMPHA